MDEKAILDRRYGRTFTLPIYQTKIKQDSNFETISRRPRRSVFSYVIAFCLVLLILSYGFQIPFTDLRAKSHIGTRITESNLVSSNHSGLVPLEAHIMSKCPDAKRCLESLVVPAMLEISDKVDFKLSFIGTIDNNDTIECMHGSTECLGNMLSLCADDIFPNEPKISLGFSTCMIMSYKQIPQRELVESCALEHGIAFDDLNACISEEGKGLDLLEASVKRSQRAGVKKSCTVRVDGEHWCVMDGGKWKDCDDGHEAEDLIKEIERRHKL